jgi:hypothetical protein
MRGRVVGICLALLACVALVPGCGVDRAKNAKVREQRAKIERAYLQGWWARRSMIDNAGLPASAINARTCGDYFDGTASSSLGSNEKFVAMGRASFIRGCTSPTPPPQLQGQAQTKGGP